ncbi:uncharacterized protein [Clytia hemisphaerica]|uniref:Aquaporin n=1 Tax=Clytia hemisphaerica TaxID=252671 RepID=A0A7M5X057_9CNID|eukprot:TCONS_00031810-protein
MHHLVWCLGTIFSSMALTAILRSIFNRFFRSTTARTLYDEFAGNFVCAVALMELLVLTFAKHNTYIFFASTYLVLFVRNVYFTYLQLYESPLIFVDLYYGRGRRNHFTSLQIFNIIVVQSVACIVGQLYIKYAWPLLDPVHQAASKENCLTTMSHHHSWYECFALEMLGTFGCTAFDFLMPVSAKPFTRPLLLCFALNYFGHVTGAWMNPMLATSFTFRCHGHDSDFMHFVVFWAAPFVGFALAWELNLFVKNLLTPSADSLEKETNETETEVETEMQTNGEDGKEKTE